MPMLELVALPLLAGLAVAPAEVERHVLQNGTVVLLLPIEGSGLVAVESFYEVGTADEPAGMTQAAHLLEHLVCNGPTKSYAARESMERLTALGMANAETLAEFTHYDYVLPAGELGLALSIEAERIASLQITAEDLGIEAPRCYQEFDMVARNPASGLLKHGLSALTQVWRHGATSIRLRVGLEALDLESLARFHASSYRPRNLTLVITGEFEREAALELVKKSLGPLGDDSDVPSFAPADWSKVARTATVDWDAPFRIVCIAFPPPEDRLERLLVAGIGNVLSTALPADADLAPLVRAIYVSNSFTGVGRMPFYAYAVAADGVELDVLAGTLAEKLEASIAKPLSKSELFSLRVQIAQRARMAEAVDAHSLEVAEAQLAKQRWDKKAAHTQVLGQLAIELGMTERLYGSEREELFERLNASRPEDLQALLARVFASENRITTFLVPLAEGR